MIITFCYPTNNWLADSHNWSVLLQEDVPELLKSVSTGCTSYHWSLVPVIDTCPQKLPATIGEAIRSACIG